MAILCSFQRRDRNFLRDAVLIPVPGYCLPGVAPLERLNQNLVVTVGSTKALKHLLDGSVDELASLLAHQATA